MSSIQIQHLLKLNVRNTFFSSSKYYNSNTTLVKVKSTDTKRQEKFFTIQIQHLLKLNTPEQN